MAGLNRGHTPGGTHGGQTSRGRGEIALLGALSEPIPGSIAAASLRLGEALLSVDWEWHRRRWSSIIASPTSECRCHKVGAAIPTPLRTGHGTLSSERHADSRHHARKGSARLSENLAHPKFVGRQTGSRKRTLFWFHECNFH